MEPTKLKGCDTDIQGHPPHPCITPCSSGAALRCCHRHPWLCTHVLSDNLSCHEIHSPFSTGRSPPQGKETQVHSGPEAESKHLLPQPGHEGCGKHIPASQPASPLSSALFSITSENALEAQPQAGLQQQFTHSIAKAHLL